MKLSVLYLGKQGAGCVYTFEMVKELRRDVTIPMVFMLLQTFSYKSFCQSR